MALRDEEVLDRIESLINQQAVNITELTNNLTTVVSTMSLFVVGLNNRPTKKQFYALTLVGVLILAAIFAQSRSNGNVVAEIRSCTTPEGKCSQEGKKSTAAALLSIQCGNISLINELADKNHFVPVAVPDECKSLSTPGK